MADMKVFNLIPKVTGAGVVIQQQQQLIESGDSSSGVNQVKAVRYQQQFQGLLALWSQIDEEIGQALRGQRVTTVAQLGILSSLKEATAAFDDFLLLVD